MKAPAASLDYVAGLLAVHVGCVGQREAYLDRTCVLRVEINYGLSAARYLDLVLRAEARHDCTVPWSACAGCGIEGLRMRVLVRRTFDRVGAPVKPLLAMDQAGDLALAVGTYDMLAGPVQRAGRGAALCSLCYDAGGEVAAANARETAVVVPSRLPGPSAWYRDSRQLKAPLLAMGRSKGLALPAPTVKPSAVQTGR